MGGDEVGIVGSAVEDNPAGGFHLAGGFVVGAMLGAHDVILEENLHVAVRRVEIALLFLLPGLDGDFLGGQCRGRGRRSRKAWATD